MTGQGGVAATYLLRGLPDHLQVLMVREALDNTFDDTRYEMKGCKAPSVISLDDMTDGLEGPMNPIT